MQGPSQRPTTQCTAVQAQHAILVLMIKLLTATELQVLAPRDQKAMQVATEIKDAMRERCLPALMHACYQLALQLQGPSPGLAAGLLQAVARYINWIDISLVANEQCALVSCLPQELTAHGLTRL